MITLVAIEKHSNDIDNSKLIRFYQRGMLQKVCIKIVFFFKFFHYFLKNTVSCKLHRNINYMEIIIFMDVAHRMEENIVENLK